MFLVNEVRRALATLSLALLPALPACSLAAPTPTQDDIQVGVARHGDTVTVHARFSVPVDARQAYAVLTDYEGMPRFLPDLDESRILARTKDGLLVRQAGKLRFGWFALPFTYVRRVELEPDARLVSHIVSGSIQKGEVTTSLTTVDGRTVIAYDSEAAMGYWLPFGIADTAIAAHVRKDLESMRSEMLRRRQPAGAASAAE